MFWVGGSGVRDEKTVWLEDVARFGREGVL
jgi:hypothetical protein